MLVIVILMLPVYLHYTLESAADLPFSDLSSLQSVAVAKTVFSMSSPIVYLLAPSKLQTKVVSCNFTDINSIVCSSYVINSSAVVAIMNDDTVIANDYSIYQLNNSKLLFASRNEKFNALCSTQYTNVQITIEKKSENMSIAVNTYSKKEGFQQISNYKLPNSDIYTLSKETTIIYYIEGSTFKIYDYAEGKTIHNSQINGTNFKNIYLSKGDKFIIITTQTAMHVYIHSMGNFNFTGMLQYNISCMEEYSMPVFIGKIYDSDRAIFFNAQTLEAEEAMLPSNSTQCSMSVIGDKLMNVEDYQINVFSIEYTGIKTYYTMSIWFIIPIGVILLVMGISLLVVCLKIKRKHIEIKAPVVEPITPIPLKSDETVITEEARRFSSYRLLMNVNMITECSLSKELLLDPVVMSDGYTYERKFINNWISTNFISPVTQQPLTNTSMYDNIPLKQFMKEWCKFGEKQV